VEAEAAGKSPGAAVLLLIRARQRLSDPAWHREIDERIEAIFKKGREVGAWYVGEALAADAEEDRAKVDRLRRELDALELPDLLKPFDAAVATARKNRAAKVLLSWSSGPHAGKVEDDTYRGHFGRVIGTVRTVDGILGQGIHFDGDSALLQTDLFVDLHPAEFTVSLWFRPEDLLAPGDRLLVGLYDGDGALAPVWSLTIEDAALPDRTLAFATQSADGAHELRTRFQRLPGGKWVHVSGVFASFESGYRKSILINGAEIAVAHGLKMLPRGMILRAGGSGRAGESVRGVIDELRYIARALTPQEILREAQLLTGR
jgi:hypothetical protein